MDPGCPAGDAPPRHFGYSPGGLPRVGVSWGPWRAFQRRSQLVTRSSISWQYASTASEARRIPIGGVMFPSESGTESRLSVTGIGGGELSWGRGVGDGRGR